MDPLTVGLLVAGGQSALNFAGSRIDQGRSLRDNLQLQEHAFQKNLDMWNRGNAYNDPSAQMARLKNAGLNPNLVYGHGATGNMATQLPQYQAPRVEYKTPPPVDLPSMLNTYQDFRLKQAQLDNMEAQNKAIKQSVENAKIHGEILTERKPGETYRSQIEQLKWGRMNAEQEELIKYLILKAQLGGQMLGYQADAMKLLPEKMRVGIDKMLQDIKYSKAGEAKLGQDVAYSKEAMNKLRADTELTRGHIGMLPTTKGAIEAKTELDQVLKSYKQQELDTYLQRMYADWLFKGIGSAKDVMDMVTKGKTGGASKGGGKVDPDNKSWQRDKETRQEWMRRVNPGAN